MKIATAEILRMKQEDEAEEVEQPVPDSFLLNKFKVFWMNNEERQVQDKINAKETKNTD